MNQCIFCPEQISLETKPEHILLKALGGRKITKKIICDSCNNVFGGTIDSALADSVVGLRNTANFRNGSGADAPKIKGMDVDGVQFDLDAGAIPKPKIIKPLNITDNGDGSTNISIQARDQEHFEVLVEGAIKKLRMPEEEASKFRTSTISDAKLTSIPSPMFHFQLDLGSEEAQRAMLKGCLILLALRIGNDELLSGRYSEAIEFVKNGTLEETGDPFTSMDCRPMPVDVGEYGAHANIIWVGSNADGRVIGYYRLYGTIAWVFELAQGGASPNFSLCLISNPFDPKTWKLVEDSEEYLNFSWISGHPADADLDVIKSSLSDILMQSKDTADREFIRQVYKDAIEELGLQEGDKMTPEIAEELAKRVAHPVIYGFMKKPYTRPLKLKPETN